MKVLKEQTFWLGAMSALAIVFFVLFIGVVKGDVAIGDSYTPPAGGGANAGNAAAPTVPAAAEPRDAVRTAVEVAKANVKKVDKCIDSGEFTDKIKDEMVKAGAAGAQGTPYSLIEKDGKYVVLSGAQPKAAIVALLDGFDAAEGTADITVEPVTKEDHTRGADDATYTIIEYSDIDCPFCARFHTTMKEVVGERDDVRWVYRHLPLPQLHPYAAMKAEASECVADQKGNDAFWTYLDAIIEG